MGDDRVTLAEQSGGPSFDQRNVCHHAHAVHVLARLHIVQRVEHNVKGLEEEQIEFGVHDVGVFRLDRHVVAKRLHLCVTATRSDRTTLAATNALDCPMCSLRNRN